MCTVLQIQLLAAVTAQSPRDDNLKRAVTPHGPCPWQHTTITTNQSTPDRIPRHRRPPLPSGSPLSHRSRATGHPHSVTGHALQGIPSQSQVTRYRASLSVTGHALQGIPSQSQVTRYRASPLSHRSRATGHPLSVTGHATRYPLSVTGHALQGIPSQSQVTR